MNPQALNAADHFSAQDVRSQLDRIVSSASFRNSQRLCKFLKFLVDKWAAGSAHDELKERIVGIEVFGRQADYDLSADPVVRVAAGDVRKRLAQYYMQEGPADEIRLDLPRGSYVLHISCALPAVIRHLESPVAQQLDSETPALVEAALPDSSSTPAALPARKTEPVKPHAMEFRTHLEWLVPLATALILIATAFVSWINSPAHQLDAFWAPVSSGPSTLICIGDLNFLMNPGQDSDELPVNRLMAIRDHVGPNDVRALGRIAGMLGRQKRAFPILLADNTNLTDLRAQPAVLIGAFDNRWTGFVLQAQRFQFKRDEATQLTEIVDTSHSAKHPWTISLANSLADIHRDYALVARIQNPVTGHFDLVVAGVGPYGTAAASEFVTNPLYFREFVTRTADWKNKDIEIILSTDVVDGRSGPPHVEMIDVR